MSREWTLNYKFCKQWWCFEIPTMEKCATYIFLCNQSSRRKMICVVCKNFVYYKIVGELGFIFIFFHMWIKFNILLDVIHLSRFLWLVRIFFSRRLVRNGEVQIAVTTAYRSFSLKCEDWASNTRSLCSEVWRIRPAVGGDEAVLEIAADQSL